MKFKRALSAVLVCSLMASNAYTMVFADENVSEVAYTAADDNATDEASEADVVPDIKFMQSGDVPYVDVPDEKQEEEPEQTIEEKTNISSMDADTNFVEYKAKGKNDKGELIDYSISVKYNYEYSNEVCGQILTVSKTQECEMEIPSVITINVNGTEQEIVIRSIDESAFQNCKATSIILPSSLKEVKDFAFSNCPNLKSVQMHSSKDNYKVTSTKSGELVPGDISYSSSKKIYQVIPTVVGNNVFENCTALKDVSISGFQTFGDYTFSGCTALTNVDLDFSNMFNCDSKTGAIKTSSAIYGKMGNYGFNNCTALESISLPDYLQSVGSNGFFAGCTNLKTLNVGLDLTSGLAIKSFENCNNLESINVAGENSDPNENNSGENRWNKTYRSIDGVLYTGVKAAEIVDKDGENRKKDGKDSKFFTVTTLVMYPAGKKDEVYQTPEMITTIPASAFEGNKYIKKFIVDTMPTYSKNSKTGEITAAEKSVAIGASIFAGSKVLESVSIKNKCTIGVSAFDGCSNLKEFIYDKTGSTMGNYAFRNCALTISEVNGWDSIGASAFSGNNSIKTLTVGANVGTIGNSAFSDCKGLVSVDMKDCGKAVTKTGTFGMNMFENCTALESIKLPELLLELSNYTFNGCTSLSNVEISDDTATIAPYAFGGCTSLQKFNGGKYLVNIQANAFDGCTKLSEVTLTRSVKNINDTAFNSCGALKTIVTPKDTYAENYANKNKYTVTNVDNDILDEDFLLYGYVSLGTKKEEDVEKYDEKYLAINDSGYYTLYSVIGYRGGFEKLTFVESETPYIVDKFISSPSSSTASMAKYLQAVDLTGIKAIGASSFSGCSNLTTVAFGDDLQEIGSSAFASCAKLCSSDIWEMSDRRIGESGSVEIKDDTEYKLTIPAKCGVVGSKAFSGCSSVKVLDLSAVSGAIGDSAFLNCTALTKVTTGEGITAIGNSAFSGCTALEDITLGKNISTIGESAFKGCTSLKTVELPDELTQISKNTFSGCANLERVKFNVKLERICENAFLNCTALTALTFNRNLFFEKNAFKGCSGVKTIVIPDAANIVSTRDPFPDSKGCTILCTDTSQATEYTKTKGYEAVKTEFVDGINYVVVKAKVEIPEDITVTKADGTKLSSGDYVVMDDVLTLTAADKGDDMVPTLYVNGTQIDADEETGATVYTVKEGDYDLAFTVEYSEKSSAINVDADGDGSITSNDAAMVLQKALNSDFELKGKNLNIDVDGDGSITANDASNVLQKSLNSDYKFPIEK